MPQRRRYYNYNRKEPEVVEIAPPVLTVPEEHHIHNDNKIKNSGLLGGLGGLGNIFTGIKDFLSKFMTEELLIIGVLILLLMEKQEEDNEDLDMLIAVLLYLLL